MKYAGLDQLTGLYGVLTFQRIYNYIYTYGVWIINRIGKRKIDTISDSTPYA